MSDRSYILYDGRATPEESGDATILVACSSNQEALGYRGDFGGMSCFSYDVTVDNKLIHERFEWNWFPGMRTKGPPFDDC